MRRSMRGFTTLIAAMAMLVGGAAPGVVALGDECPLLTAAEVEAALSIKDIKVSSAGTFCTFDGDASLYLATQLGMDLEQQREDFEDAVDLTVGGNPAIASEQSRSIAVGLPGQLLGASYYGGLDWATALPALTGLLELAIPRLPAGPDPADVARLQALIPATIDGDPTTIKSYGGDMLLSLMDQTAAPVIALSEALAAQGKSASDVLIAGGDTTGTDASHSVVAVLIKGADASQLVEPLFRAFSSSTTGEATFTPIEVAGRPAIRIEGGSDQGPLIAMTSGDVILAASVPEGELEAIFAGLP